MNVDESIECLKQLQKKYKRGWYRKGNTHRFLYTIDKGGFLIYQTKKSMKSGSTQVVEISSVYNDWFSKAEFIGLELEGNALIDLGEAYSQKIYKTIVNYLGQDSLTPEQYTSKDSTFTGFEYIFMDWFFPIIIDDLKYMFTSISGQGETYIALKEISFFKEFAQDCNELKRFTNFKDINKFYELKDIFNYTEDK